MKKTAAIGTTYFIDQTSVADHHMVFNACMLEILANLFKQNCLVSVGIKSNQDSIRELLPKELNKAIVFKTLKYSETSRKSILVKSIFFARKEIIRFLIFYKLLQKSTKNDIIVLSITTFTSFLVFKFLKLFFKVPVIAVLHGDLDFVYNSTTLYEKINGLTHRLIFKIRAKDFYYLVLNKISKPYLVADGYLCENDIMEINHPFSQHRFKSSIIKQPKESIITFGHIGSLEAARKNSHLIYELGANFKKEIQQHKILLKAIGLSTPSMKGYRNEWVNEVVGNGDDGKPKYLKRNAYEAELDGLDYALFFYSKEQYVFRASGAIADAIANEIPLIVLEHPFFNNLFEYAGSIGYLCKDVFEMKVLIKKIIETPQDFMAERKLQKQNLKKAQELMSVNSIVKDLSTQMKKRNLCS